MKKYADIIKDIKKARASITDTAKIEKALTRETVRNALDSGDGDALELARTKYHELEQKYIEENEKNDNAKLRIALLKDNAAQAFFAENITIICDIWNKYVGKSYGEKTRDKINLELKSVIGYAVYIDNNYNDANIRVYFPWDNDPASFNKLEFIRTGSISDTMPALSSSNKILEINPKRFRVYNCGEYIENINAHIKALKKAHQAARDAEKKFTDAVRAYNDLTRGNIARASTREGVKTWLI